MKKHLRIYLFTFIALSIFLAACSQGKDDNTAKENSDQEEATQEDTTDDSVLNIALDAPPASLDQPASTETAARDISRLVFEPLVATNSKHEPVPMLADTIETDDNQTYIFNLRKGVKFHNGQEMTADDVVASMERWLEKSNVTGNLFKDSTWEVIDDYTVELTLAKPSALTLDTLASTKQSAGIMPKEIVENAPAEGVEEYIGTGPYEFVEWKTDQYIHFTRFDDYQSLEDEADGLSGKKEASIKDIYVHLVPDSTTRIAGLQTGEYDFVFRVPFDNYEQIKDDPNLDLLLHPSSNGFLGFNKAEGPAADFKLRQAINAALDNNEIMLAGFPIEEFYWLDSGYMDKDMVNWASTAGEDQYNQNDPEKAKQILDEMGYDGEEFRIVATRDTDFLYNMAVVIHEQLKNVGINSTLDVYDTTTMYDITDNKPSEWDAFVSASSAVSTPPQLIALSSTWAGGTNDSYVEEKMNELEHAEDVEEAQELWDEIQRYAWEELLPIAHIGGYNNLHGLNSKVEGITASSSGPVFWNAKITE